MSPIRAVHWSDRRPPGSSSVASDLGIFGFYDSDLHRHRDTLKAVSREKVGMPSTFGFCVVSVDTKQSGLR